MVMTPGMWIAEVEKSKAEQRKEQEIFLKTGTVRIQNDWGHTLLPSNFREQLGWELETKLTAKIDISTKTVILHKKADGELEALEIGTVRLDESLRKKLGWRVGDKLSVTDDAKNSTITYSKHHQ